MKDYKTINQNKIDMEIGYKEKKAMAKYRKQLEDYKQELRDQHTFIYFKLGDYLEYLFRVTGVKWLVKKIYPNCNCDKRQKALNFKIKRR